MTYLDKALEMVADIQASADDINASLDRILDKDPA